MSDLLQLGRTEVIRHLEDDLRRERNRLTKARDEGRETGPHEIRIAGFRDAIKVLSIEWDQIYQFPLGPQ